jgi:hypothetical protein
MAYYAKGTQFQVGDGATPEVFTLIPGCQDIEGPGGDTEEIDTTDHDSPGNTAEFIATLVDGGEVRATMNWDPAGTIHQQLASDQTSLTVRNFQLILTDPDATKVRFPGFVRSFRAGMPVRGQLRSEFVVRVAGAINWDAT